MSPSSEATEVRLPSAGVPDRTMLRMSAERIEVGRAVVLREVELELAAGEFVGIRGPNGAGKSTLLRAMAGLVTGPWLMRRLDVGGGASGHRTPVALIGHAPSVHPRLTLLENLRLALDLAGVRDVDAQAALERVGLAGAGARFAGDCSHGMQRRADLARAWALQPGLLLLDEPTAGLDGAARRLPEQLAVATIERGGAVVVATHEAASAIPAADRWLEVDHGTVRAA